MDGGVLGGDESDHDNAYALVAKDGPYFALPPAWWSDRNPGLNATKWPGLVISLMPEVGSASVPASVQETPRKPGVFRLWRPLSRSNSSRFGYFLHR